MRIVLSDEAYAKLDRLAKAKGTTTQHLGSEIVLEYLNNQK